MTKYKLTHRGQPVIAVLNTSSMTQYYYYLNDMYKTGPHVLPAYNSNGAYDSIELAVENSGEDITASEINDKMSTIDDV